ncbi:hypothetical protein GM418_27855 [Maribellus comscasis]|uniref:DUF973 family protein n=2 Tax=Maribellus comscasis TaxID=2681766 RepID=A0A6I6K3P8_9BACT|nr:hypothetical protein GM418_27855 [Maribellus comscasis]
MEESSRFLSLSGLSGILIGIYALLGAFVAYQLIYTSQSFDIYSSNLIPKLIFIALTVLAISLVTVVFLTYKRAKKSGKKIWNPGSRLMLLNLAIPLISGGILIFIFVFRGIYEIISPACLIFYGLALVNAAKFTRQEIFYIGLIQVFLGILAALFPMFALLLWALGFGIIHVIYGAVMYFRYEHQTKA